MTTRSVARRLAWFGIGLGLAELLAPRATARAAGLQGREKLVWLFGVREIATGVLVLRARDPRTALWARVGGDLLDGMLLSRALKRGRPGRGRAVLATLVVAPVAVLDLWYARHVRHLGKRVVG
ncbi:hypothetical protein [Rhizosaccharibacter radicis]|uniref:DUF4267 domain-containing protein n=1 Tax=Rhizosaccharibacter radicis TaxID=2782605 RepID=A0ABT1VUI2_9PROT|nr:hypothetical protein [Acetobacteraceae bacterium KSS12]